MLTDIEIAQEALYNAKNIFDIADKIGVKSVAPYGGLMGKVEYNNYGDKNGKLILVTAINPTPLGEGKTTMSIGLADGMRQIGKDAVLCLREPSLGPVFGVKGGAAGGGYSQVIPMENINLHFTGDLHAIENANNLLAALIDNHIYQGNELDIQTVTWRRCMDMNDRQLRYITDGLGGKTNGVPRDDGFDITVASEVMAIFCLATDLDDLKRRLGNIIIGYNSKEEPITARDLKADGAMTVLLKDAFNPNLVQTLEGTPAFIHGGPFANIAHGCNSVVATKLALSRADYVVTEAGFGADLGAEKFFDIKCRMAGLTPNAVVIVATTKALKYNGGVPKENVKEPNMDAMIAGLCNLERHIKNIQSFGVPVVVAINKYHTDIQEELEALQQRLSVNCVVCTSFAEGGKGAIDLAEAVLDAIDENPQIHYQYRLWHNTYSKICDLAMGYYGAQCVHFTAEVLDKIEKFEKMGFNECPICIAKTQYSFSDDPKLLGAPEDFTFQVQDVRLSAGAGFIVVICGKIMTMPGLPKVPAANSIDIDEEGNIIGLF
jgi:formate--tetrahydrofolate ligase